MPTPHPPDFMDAHLRFWEDAELLFENERWASADQMYGFSAECGLKAMIEGLGESIDDRYRKHVQDLWPKFMSFSHSHSLGALCLSFLPEGQPFSDWSHHDRYANRNHANEERATSHRLAARAIVAMVEARLLQGIPP